MPFGRSPRGSETVQVSAFLLLPAEIILEILEQDSQDLWKSVSAHQEPQSLPPGILKATSICTRIRLIALAYRPLWRIISEVVLWQLDVRAHINTLHLLRFCARLSANTLSTANMRAFPDSLCPQKMIDIVSVFEPCRDSIESLSLPLPTDPEFAKACSCDEYCQDNPQATMKDAWYRGFELIQSAVNLWYLRLALPPAEYLPSSDDFADGAKTLSTRPEELRVDLELLDASISGIPAGFHEWLAKLATGVKELHLDCSSRFLEELTETSRLMSSIIKAASPNAHELSVSGDPYGVVVDQLLPRDFPNLKVLRLQDLAEGAVMQLPAPLTTRCFSSLVSIAIPAWLLPYFEAPLIQEAELLLLHSSDEDVVTSKLAEWPKMESLILHMALEPREASQAVQGILRSLKPSEDSALSPNLKRLAIVGRLITSTSIQKFFGEALAKKDNAEAAYSKAASDFWKQIPLIGMDLYHVVNRRQQLSAKQNSQGSPICSDLTTLCIDSCIVDHVAWTLILDIAGLKDKTATPDPIATRQRLLEDSPTTGEQDKNERQALLTRLSEAFYKLNGPPI